MADVKNLAEQITAANGAIKSIPVKNKNYVMVNERVKAFRAIAPEWSISTEILSLDGGVVTMKATITDIDGRVIATGHAQEKETSSYINKTSFIENCETSAVGRAIGFFGIGIDDSMGSADEVAAAIMNKNSEPEDEPKGKTNRDRLTETCNKYHIDTVALAEEFGLNNDASDEQFGKALAAVQSRIIAGRANGEH